MNTAPLSEPIGAGFDQLPAVLPASLPLSGPWEPTSDQPWLTLGTVAQGRVSFTFGANPGEPRIAVISLLGEQIAVNQDGRYTPHFSELGQPTITYGAPSVVISGNIDDIDYGIFIPIGESVSITLDGVTHAALVAGDGSFSTTFDTRLLHVTDSGYSIAFNYAGDSTYAPASDHSRLTVIPAPSVTRSRTTRHAYGSTANLSKDLPAMISTGVNGQDLSILYGSAGNTAGPRWAVTPSPAPCPMAPGRPGTRSRPGQRHAHGREGDRKDKVHLRAEQSSSRG